MDRLKGKRALITGGTTGIGLAIARHFLLEGASVMVTGLNEDTLARARQELGSEVSVVKADAGSLEDRQHLRALVEARFGQLDVAVLNAGIGVFRPLHLWDEEASIALSMSTSKDRSSCCKRCSPSWRTPLRWC